MSADRGSLCFSEQRAIGRSEIVGAKQPAVLGLDPRADSVRIAARRLNAVQQAGHHGCYRRLHHRAARTAVGHRIANLAIRFDDVFLHHHHRFSRQQLVVVLRVLGRARVGDNKAGCQRVGVENCGGAGSCLETIGRRACTHLPHQLAVPALLRCPRLPRLCRIEVGHDLIDRAIDCAFLEAQHVLHRVPAIVGEVRDVGIRGSSRRIV